MLSLKQIQDAFTAHVMNSDPVIKAFVSGSKKVPTELRLDIYRNAYRERLIETLAGDYEVLAELLKEEAFRRLCITYIDRYPSTHYSLRWFGDNLPTFLGYSAEEGIHEWEAELTQLEWSFTKAFDAANAMAVTEQDALAIPPESWTALSVTFHPSVFMLKLWWNTLDLWQATKHEKRPPSAVRLHQYSHCLIWRNNLLTQYRSLDADEAVALYAAMSGATFPEICGALAEELENTEEVPLKAAGYLKDWLATGMIIQLNT